MRRFGKWLDFENHHGILVACNGVYIEDMQTGEVLLNESMSAQLTSSILEHLKKI